MNYALELRYDGPLSNFVFKFKLRRYHLGLHWRRGDKCGGAARPGAPHKVAGVTFDSTNGSATALLCSDYADAEVLNLCRAMPPFYVATDDNDPVFLDHLRSHG